MFEVKLNPLDNIQKYSYLLFATNSLFFELVAKDKKGQQCFLLNFQGAQPGESLQHQIIFMSQQTRQTQFKR